MDRAASHKSAFLLALLTLAALGLRLVGLGYSLPHRPDDDSVAVSQAQILRRIWRGETVESRSPLYYPLLLGAIAAATGVCQPRELGPEPATLSAHVAAASRPFRGMRALVAVLSTACVLAMYLLARRFLGRGEALLAAAFLATSLLHLDFSRQARPHAPAVTFAVIALPAILRAHARPGPWAYIWAGVAAGLAAATLQTGAAVALPLGLSCAVHLRRQRSAALPAVLAAGLCCAAITLAAYFHPYPREGAALFSVQPGRLIISGHPAELTLFNGRGFARLARYFLSYDPLVLGLALLGTGLLALRAWRARAWRGPPGRVALLLAHAGPYFVVFGLFSWISDRFALPLLPHVALLASVGVAWLADRLPPSRLGSPAARLAAAGALALLLPTAAATSLVVQQTRLDTEQQAARFV